MLAAKICQVFWNESLTGATARGCPDGRWGAQCDFPGSTAQRPNRAFAPQADAQREEIQRRRRELEDLEVEGWKQLVSGSWLEM